MHRLERVRLPPTTIRHTGSIGLLERGVGRRVAAAGTLLAGLLASACSNGQETVAAQCTDSPATIRAALHVAPGRVTLGGVPLSRCFARRADQGAVESLGQTMVPTTASLADSARAAPGSHATLELGYLIGAARRGAARTEGIYYELERRMEQELVGLDTNAPAFTGGLRAGEAGG